MKSAPTMWCATGRTGDTRAPRRSKKPLPVWLLKMGTLSAPQRHLVRLINSGQTFVSAAWHESFNLAALETMACGFPVVMTDDGGSTEYAVDGQNALVVEPRDPSALRDQILRLQGDKALRASLVEGRLQTVWQYDWDSVTADFANLVLG